MSDLLNRLGYLQTRRDRTPNLDLARDLVARDDKDGIQEIAKNMWNENKNIHGDCMNVMYEIAIIDPVIVLRPLQKVGQHQVHVGRDNGIAPLGPVERDQADVILDQLIKHRFAQILARNLLPTCRIFVCHRDRSPKFNRRIPRACGCGPTISYICDQHEASEQRFDNWQCAVRSLPPESAIHFRAGRSHGEII